MKNLIFLLIIFLVGCASRSESSNEEIPAIITYSDGKHCAEVNYYNPNTNTKSTYTLNVEVEDNALVRIYWGNGGWLDETHFSPIELNEEGFCSFASDKGYQYEVQITGDESSVTDNPKSENDRSNRRMQLRQCASSIQMTESELLKYETDFNIRRTDFISIEMCEALSNYITKIRELNSEIENGYIQKIYYWERPDEIVCQHMIVKRKSTYYWLLVGGRVKSTMGTIRFNHQISNWQDVIVKKSPESTSMQVMSMRILEQSGDLSYLSDKMENYCSLL
jgi:hypothetical protein